MPVFGYAARLMASRILSIASVALCGAVLGACGESDGQGGQGGESAKTFEAPDIAFSFKYPAAFTQVNEDDGKVLASVLPDTGDTNNAVKVRKTSDQELQLSTYLDEIRRQFAQQLGRVDRRIERHSDLEMGVLSFRAPTTVEEGGQQRRVNLSSASYFFAGGGKTWQVECLSTDAHRAQIDAACRQAVNSVSF